MHFIDIDSLIKFIGLNICFTYSFGKVTNYCYTSTLKKLLLIPIILSFAFFQCFLQPYTPLVLRIFLIYFNYSLILSSLTKISITQSLITSIVSLTLSYIGNFISIWIVLLFMKFNPFNILFNDTEAMSISIFINIILVYLIFKIKKFKYGFPFLKKDFGDNYLDIYVLSINIIIVFIYFLFKEINSFSIVYFIIGFLLLVLILFIIIQKSFILYQKQKLQLQALKNYEQELSETKRKLETALTEKEQIVKSNHEFYHRQEALNKKLDNLINLKANSMNTEFGNEYSDILDRLNTLSSEYKTKTRVLPVLDKTNIAEIDDMLIYMQSECAKYNIEFTVKIDCDINYIINNLIAKSQLETLLGDLLRNAIIAVNHSSNYFKSIMVILGIKDDSYELCIYDSGIPFEIETLVNLGVQPASTHLDEGGTGIGFITTFETINSCKASFIINEITNNNYTKSLEVKFDNKNEYVIISNRSDEIRKANVLNRNIILK